MSKSRKMMIALGLALVFAPITASSSNMIVDEVMEEVNITRIIENEVVEVDFESTVAEMHKEQLKIEKELSKKEESKKEYLGKFRISFYCGCYDCNGKWTGYPAKNGEELKEGYTIAVDPNVIPLNSWVEIEGKKYKSCDTGSAIKGNRIDIYIDDHEECYRLGIKNDIDVYMIRE